MSRFVRIVVVEPIEWDRGNLIGEVISEFANDKVKIRVTQSIKGRTFSSDVMILTPLINNETFRPLHQYYTVMARGSIVNEHNNEQQYVLTGTVTYD